MLSPQRGVLPLWECSGLWVILPFGVNSRFLGAEQWSGRDPCSCVARELPGRGMLAKCRLLGSPRLRLTPNVQGQGVGI